MHTPTRPCARRLLLLLPALLLLTACGGDGAVDGSAAGTEPTLVTEYTITDSGGNLTENLRVAVLQGDVGQTTCPSVSPTSIFNVVLAGAANVATAGSVTISVTRVSANALAETVYIDNGDGQLSNGDTVWGTDPSGLKWVCWDFAGAEAVPTHTYDWTDDIVGPAGLNFGQTTFDGTGGPFPF